MTACALPAAAGLLTTDRTLANFQFVANQVDYAPDPDSLTLRTAGSFAFTDPASVVDLQGNRRDPLRGALHLTLKGNAYGNFLRSDFNVFGSLPTPDQQPAARLLITTAQALRPDSKPGTLEFLIDRDLIAGPLASQYRGVGIFMLVPGVDELTWVRGFADGAATMQLIAAENAIAKPRQAQAMPISSTLTLLALGVPLLRRRRAWFERRCESPSDVRNT